MSGTNSAKIVSNFFLSFVLDGLILNSGYIFHAIKKQWRWEGPVAIIPLNVNKALSGIIGAIFIMRTCSKDSKSVILWGSLLCATGIGLSSITKDISWLIVFWGAVFGIGHAITSTYLQKELASPDKETIQKIFLKCAPNVGGVFLPFVLERLFDQYDLTGSCLILCGIILNYIPLSLLAFYNIGPKWKKFKWTVRKRSSKYKINNQTNMNTAQNLKQTNSYRNKVLANCLEPDMVSYKLSVDNESFETDYSKSIPKNSMEKEKDSFDSFASEIKEIAINVPNIIEENNMDVLKKQIENLPNGTKLILDIEKYENEHKIFEEDFYAKDTSVSIDNNHVVGNLNEKASAISLTSDKSDKNLDCDSELVSNTEIIINDTSPNDKISKKIFEEDFYSKDTSVSYDSNHVVGSLEEKSSAISLTYDESDKNLDCDSELTSNTEIIINDSRPNDKISIKIYEEDFYAKDTSVSDDSNHVVGNLEEKSSAISLTSDESDKNLDCDSQLACNTEIIRNDTSPNETTSTNCPNSVLTLSQSNANETPLSSVKQIEQFLPDMFKVNVLECTFESESDYMQQISQPVGKLLKKNNYRHHANSLMTQCYDNVDFTEVSARNKTLFGKNYDRSKQVDNIYNVYDKDKYKITYRNPKSTNASAVGQFQNQQANFFHKLKEIFKTLKLLSNRECLLVLLITVIAEYIMTVLTVLICSFAEETGVKESHFKWIISAFAVGGVLGKYCFYYINKILSPKISITSAILFMLNSIAIIGVLWSSSLKWYINFYLMLGILQGCIQASFTKIREVYIHENSNKFLSSASKFLFGVVILSLPHLIRFTRSFSGDFEILLEVIGCCSAFCAILCFSLQKCSLCCIVK